MRKNETVFRLIIRREIARMGKNYFDYDDGDFVHTISDNMAIDSDGDMLLRMGGNIAMDMETGDIHFISAWSDDDDD